MMSTRALTTTPPASEALSLGDVLTADDAAALLGVSSWTLYAAANRHEVRHRRLGRRCFSLAAPRTITSLFFGAFWS
jgi:hypothetical protein